MISTSWHRAIAVVLLSLLPLAAAAGAWPRDPGRVFLSYRMDHDRAEGRTRPSLYGEYGLSRRLTLAGQVAEAEGDDWVGDWQLPRRYHRITAQLRVALGPQDARHRFALSGGVSSPPDRSGAVARARLETALHWGYGFESRIGPGWATATAKLGIAPDGTRVTSDGAALIGLRPRDGVMTMLSINRYRDSGGTSWKVSPAAGFELRPDLWLVPSLTREISGGDTGLALSVWLNL